MMLDLYDFMTLSVPLLNLRYLDFRQVAVAMRAGGGEYLERFGQPACQVEMIINV